MSELAARFWRSAGTTSEMPARRGVAPFRKMIKNLEITMKPGKIFTLACLLLALVAIVNHQLTQNSKNASLITAAQAASTATETPTPTPTATATPTSTPVIGESCTPGFYKTHTSFINGGSCVGGVTKDTLVSTIFGVGSGIDPCVSGKTLLGVLQAPASACGSGTTAQKQLNLMRQAISAWLNATTSSPSACSAATGIVNATNQAIAAGDATMAALQDFLEKNVNNDKIGRCVD